MYKIKLIQKIILYNYKILSINNNFVDSRQIINEASRMLGMLESSLFGRLRAVSYESKAINNNV